MQQLKNVVSNWAAFAISAVVGFFIAPIIVRQLGTATYGVWVLIGSLVGYLGLLDLGVRGAVTRFVARYYVSNDTEAANRLTSSALAFFGLVAVLALVVGGVLTWLLPSIVNMEPHLVLQSRQALVLCAVTIAVSLMGGVYGGVIAGLQRFSTLSAVDVGVELARALAVYLMLRSGGGLVALATIALLSAGARTCAYAIVARRLYPALRLNVRLADRRSIRHIIGFSSAASVLHLSGMLILYSDSLVIGTVLTVSAVTFFAIAANLTDYARSVLSGLSSTLAPLASATQAGGSAADLRRLLLRYLRISLALLLPIVITFQIRGSTFIGLWMGAEYAALSGRLLLILSTAFLFTVSHQVLTVIMMGLNIHRRMVPVFIAEAVANLALSIVLAHSLGVVGVALGTLIPRVVVALVVNPWLAHRALGVSARAYASDAWLRPLLAGVPFAGATALLERFWPAPTMPLFFAQVLLALPFAAAGIWLAALTRDERAGLIAAVRQRVAGSAAQLHARRAPLPES